MIRSFQVARVPTMGACGGFPPRLAAMRSCSGRRANLTGRESRLDSRTRRRVGAIARRGRHPALASARRRPLFMLDIVAANGTELETRLLEQGVSSDEVILKYCWPRYAPSSGTGMRSIAKSENLVAQFERLIAMHRDAPSSFPMPLGTVKSPEGEFAGYIIEFVSGDTLGTLLARGAVAEARKQLASVVVVMPKR